MEITSTRFGTSAGLLALAGFGAVGLSSGGVGMALVAGAALVTLASVMVLVVREPRASRVVVRQAGRQAGWGR